MQRTTLLEEFVFRCDVQNEKQKYKKTKTKTKTHTDTQFCFSFLLADRLVSESQTRVCALNCYWETAAAHMAMERLLLLAQFTDLTVLTMKDGLIIVVVIEAANITIVPGVCVCVCVNNSQRFPSLLSWPASYWKALRMRKPQSLCQGLCG